VTYTTGTDLVAKLTVTYCSIGYCADRISAATQLLSRHETIEQPSGIGRVSRNTGWRAPPINNER